MVPKEIEQIRRRIYQIRKHADKTGDAYLMRLAGGIAGDFSTMVKKFNAATKAKRQAAFGKIKSLLDSVNEVMVSLEDWKGLEEK